MGPDKLDHGKSPKPERVLNSVFSLLFFVALAATAFSFPDFMSLKIHLLFLFVCLRLLKTKFSVFLELSRSDKRELTGLQEVLLYKRFVLCLFFAIRVRCQKPNLNLFN